MNNINELPLRDGVLGVVWRSCGAVFLFLRLEVQENWGIGASSAEVSAPLQRKPNLKSPTNRMVNIERACANSKVNSNSNQTRLELETR